MALSQMSSHLSHIPSDGPAFFVNIALMSFFHMLGQLWDDPPCLVHNVGGDGGFWRGDPAHCLGEGVGGGDQLATAGHT